MSHPAWVCGLKLGDTNYRNIGVGHTLRGCVDWNIRLWHNDQSSGVTPCVGVWIETTASCRACITPKSHPAWVCGLKLDLFSINNQYAPVTPCVGVWIETVQAIRSAQRWRCHTLRGCVDWNGLYVDEPDFFGESHPAWVCGLKHLRLPGGDTCTWSHPAWVYMDWSIVHSLVKFMEEL